MRAVVVLALWAVLQAGPPPPQAPAPAVDPGALRYGRAVQATRAGLNCAVLDPAIFAHAAGSLRDLRLLDASGREVPFVLTLSGTADQDTVSALAVQARGAGVAFDLPMPARAYTDVILDIAATDLVGRAEVSAGPSPGLTPDPGVTPGPAASLGHFAIWDLSSQGLGRSMVLHLQESHAPVLHVELQPVAGVLRPEQVHGATVPPTRDTQTLFTTAVRSTRIRQVTGATVAELTLPPHVPVERLRIVVGPGAGNFRREVRIDARPEGQNEAETITGEIDRLHAVRAGLALDEDRLLLPATIGANLQGPAHVRVTIKNGTAAALPVRAVELDTRERQLCFDADAPGERLSLLYGDPQLHAPVYGDYTRRYAAESRAAVALIAGERPNPAFVTEQGNPTLRQRHPRLVYLAPLLGLCLLVGALLRSERRSV